MALRTSVGAVTISDIKDGINPLSVVLSNQSHTFAASPTGDVSGAEAAKFSCEVFAFVGETRATYDAALTADNTYSVAVTDPTDWVSAATTTLNQRIITITTIPTGTTNNTGIIELDISIRNSVGNTTVVKTSISLAKAIEGAGGTIITLTPTRQTFRYDAANTTTDGNITITVATQGNVGALTAERSINGGAFSTLNIGATAGLISVMDIDGVGGNDQLVLTPANFAGATTDTLAIRVLGNGTSDTVSFIKIQDGLPGDSALLVTISSSVEGFQFKNNTGTTKTLTARIFDMADGSEIVPGAGVTYQWYVDNVLEVGQTADTISVSSTDIPDGGAEQYSCQVTVTV